MCSGVGIIIIQLFLMATVEFVAVSSSAALAFERTTFETNGSSDCGSRRTARGFHVSLGEFWFAVFTV